VTPAGPDPAGPDDVERVLAERARLLARPLPEAPSAPLDELAVLAAGGERYAVDLASVDRVHPVEAVTPVPGLRPPWAGLVALRGELLPALDVPAYLGRPPALPVGAGSGSGAAYCAVVAHGGLRAALLSDEPVTLMARPAGGLSAPLAPLTAPAGAVVGVTGDLVTILDVASILADPALVVDD
jgi:chemotaxis signal transduction protein